MAEIPQGTTRCEDGTYYVECPVCRRDVKVRKVERSLGKEPGTGRHLGHHTEPDLAAYERHYEDEHGGGHG